jgi:tRNA 2-selenouridine synthase
MIQIDDLQTVCLADIPLIDTRSPSEFAKGSLPTATNLPLMNDDERAAVGTCYQQQGQDAAVRLGHQLVSGTKKDERVALWQGFAADHPNGALFCFRGGLRSTIAQQWLADTGIEYPRIRGGYKALRRWLVSQSDAIFENSRLILLGGRTGVAKTRALNEGKDSGPLPGSIDLEGLANHRGSAFGKRTSEQPTQIGFELAVGITLVKHRNHNHPHLILEDEGRLIGRCALPLSLQAARQHAEWVRLEASLEDRIQHSYENYILSNLGELNLNDSEHGFRAFSAGLLDALERIQKRLGGQRYQALRAVMTDAIECHRRGDPQQHKHWIASLLTDYYDPMYDYQMAKRSRPPVFTGSESEVADYLTARQQ